VHIRYNSKLFYYILRNFVQSKVLKQRTKTPFGHRPRGFNRIRNSDPARARFRGMAVSFASPGAAAKATGRQMGQKSWRLLEE
jgi:hypothetical protein